MEIGEGNEGPFANFLGFPVSRFLGKQSAHYTRYCVDYVGNTNVPLGVVGYLGKFTAI